ncbi:MAG: 6-carboxytetrahydropterin synthase QueD [Bacteroidetes bacterium]|nr:6-carboxytetrahydropterin synthase QueD [Bacteroidota bacterium]
MEVFKEFSFDSAHFLPNVPVGHKCREMHGHTYRLVVYLEGPIDEKRGWVIDFAELKEIVKGILADIDHKCLNNLSGLENPTCELLAKWLWGRLKKELPGLKNIVLHETPTSGVVYNGN